MRIFILGTSNTSGVNLDEPGMTWAQLFAAEAERAGFELVDRTFHANGPRALSYLDRLIEETRPECVLVTLSAYAFTVSGVEFRIANRFGPRATAAYKRLEQPLLNGSAKLGEPGLAAGRLARRAGRRLLGTASMLDETLATETWLGVLDRLAREEAVRVIVLSAIRHSERFLEANPGAREMTARFNATILAAVERHRFEWFDQEIAYDTAPGGRESSFARDGTHANAETHRRLATLVWAAFAEPAGL